MTLKVAINGYGRIGRGLHRQIIERDDMEVVAINSRSGADSHAYLLRYDSLYGKCNADISVDGANLKVNGKTVYVYQVKNPADINWKEHDIDVVIEATGQFTTKASCDAHISAGAKKVLITAPCKDKDVPTIVMGVNEGAYDSAKYSVFSNASCTTNCLAPTMKVLVEKFGVESAFVTTIHAYTYTQNLLDNSNPEDFRRARATMESIIPTTTGAMKAIADVIPELTGKIDGMAFRVPVPTVSCIDVVAKLGREVSAEEVNSVFVEAGNGALKGILGTCDEPLVSVDFRGDSHSSIVDLPSTKVLPGGYVKVVAWYDNEWGYISRIVDLLKWIKI